MRSPDTFCDASWIVITGFDGRVCGRCYWKVSGEELREKGTIPALEEKARACQMARAIESLNRRQHAVG